MRLRILTTVLVLVQVATTWGQSSKARPDLRVTFYLTSDRRAPEGIPATSSCGVRHGDHVPHARAGDERLRGRPRSASDALHDPATSATACPSMMGSPARGSGERGQFHVRAGHMWLPDLGTAGALAGGLVEYRGGDSKSTNRLKVGAFMGAEPLGTPAGTPRT